MRGKGRERPHDPDDTSSSLSLISHFMSQFGIRFFGKEEEDDEERVQKRENK